MHLNFDQKVVIYKTGVSGKSYLQRPFQTDLPYNWEKDIYDILGCM